MDTNVLAGKQRTLWILALSPAIWSAHFLLCYVSAALWCGKFAGPFASLHVVRMATVAYTAVALAAIGVVGVVGYRAHSHGAARLPHDDDSPADRHRFLGFATLLLSWLSAVAVIYSALAALFIETCE